MKHTVITQTSNSAQEAFLRLYHVLKILRSPEGCPWDREQTPKKFYKNILEEAYEYIDAYNENDTAGCREELGDLYLVITMLSIMHEESNDFSVIEILEQTSEKLIRRHPHVFTPDVTVSDAGSVVELWDSIKEQVEGKRSTQENPFNFIPKALPPLERSEEIQKIARKRGFDWPTFQGALQKIEEELVELKAALEQEDTTNIEEEIGDLLFSVVNVARICKVNPHIALHRTNEKFIKRYNTMVTMYQTETGKTFDQAEFEDMDLFWEKAKAFDTN